MPWQSLEESSDIRQKLERREPKPIIDAQISDKICSSPQQNDWLEHWLHWFKTLESRRFWPIKRENSGLDTWSIVSEASLKYLTKKGIDEKLTVHRLSS